MGDTHAAVAPQLRHCRWDGTAGQGPAGEGLAGLLFPPQLCVGHADIRILPRHTPGRLEDELCDGCSRRCTSLPWCILIPAEW